MEKKINKSLYSLFIFFCFFPYIRIIPLDTDSQPNALLLGLIVLILYRPRKMVKELFCLFLLMVWAILLMIFSRFDFENIRSLLNYISLFVIATASYFILCRNGFISFKHFKMVVYIWGGTALIQQFIFPTFGSFLITRITGAGMFGRGVTSLAPEPTFYAIICVLLSIICFLNFRTKPGYTYIQWIIWGQMVLLSRSTTVLLIAIASYFVYQIVIIAQKNPKALLKLLVFTTFFFIVINILVQYIESYRFGALLKKLLEEPQIFVNVDESVNERFIHAFFPLLGFITNYCLPHGYGCFSDYMSTIVKSGQFADYLPYVKSSYPRIMSGIGSALFELGCPGLLLLLVWYKCVVKFIKINKHILLYGILFLCILFNAMPLSNAMVGFVFGNLIYNAHKSSYKRVIKDVSAY